MSRFENITFSSIHLLLLLAGILMLLNGLINEVLHPELKMSLLRSWNQELWPNIGPKLLKSIIAIGDMKKRRKGKQAEIQVMVITPKVLINLRKVLTTQRSKPLPLSQLLPTPMLSRELLAPTNPPENRIETGPEISRVQARHPWLAQSLMPLGLGINSWARMVS